VWRKDGKEVYYLDSERALMAVTVEPEETNFQVRPPSQLFEIHVSAIGNSPYDASADGQRFIMIVPESETPVTGLTLVTNWDAGLTKP
jgi:hypothetical protein